MDSPWANFPVNIQADSVGEAEESVNLNGRIRPLWGESDIAGAFQRQCFSQYYDDEYEALLLFHNSAFHCTKYKKNSAALNC